MTRQEIFDKSTSAVLAQGGPATDGRYCRLRTPDGKRCHLGACIHDSLYKVEAEDYTVSDLLPLMGLEPEDISLSFLMDFRDVHDRGTYNAREFWPRYIKDALAFGKRWNLDTRGFADAMSKLT